jgi:pullulanase/glycogen debranching enzyme
MLQMGDEYGHSKRGNNNTYCHDCELNWMDWEAVDTDPTGFVRFMRQLIHFRWDGGGGGERGGGYWVHGG